jgi:hypothetical protein
MTTASVAPTFPMQFSVEYPDRDLNRLTTAFRIFTVIPVAIVLGTLSAASTSGLLFVGPLLMILFRQKYPRWWFDWNLQLLRFQNRVTAYLLLLRDEYPATDDDQAVHVDVPYPDARLELNRWLPLVKWFLAIPHYVVLVFLAIAGFFVVIAAWFAILFTGRYPRPWFDFLAGVMRWANRVAAYAFILVTDQYPPLRLAP